MEDNEIQAASSGVSDLAAVNPGTTADPGPGTYLDAAAPTIAAPPARPAGLPNRGGRPRGSKTGAGKRPLTDAQRANLAKGRAAAAQARAKAATGKAAPKTAAKTGGGTKTGGQTESPPDFTGLVVNPQPLDVPMSITETKLDMLHVVKQTLAMIADINRLNKPLLDPGVVNAISQIQAANGMRPTIAEQGGIEYLQHLWTFEDAELESVAIPITNMIPDLPARAQKMIEKVSNPLALVAAAYLVIVPKIVSERNLTNAIRAFNAGTVPASSRNGASNSAQTGNGTGSVPDTKVPDYTAPGAQPD